MNNKSFSEHFSIKEQSIEFIDIPLEEDLLAFICPFLIENNRDKIIAQKVHVRLKKFLTKLNNDFIKTNDRNNGLSFLSHLHEPNEFHLGYSQTNTGKAIAKDRAKVIFDALRNNRFSKQEISITNEAYAVLLLVKGIGQDIMCDVIANVCRDIFADWTTKICRKNNIPTSKFKIEYYNSISNKWDYKTVMLPKYTNEIILLPKFIISRKRDYTTCYNRFIAKNYIAYEILNNPELLENSKEMFVQMDDGTKEPIIKIIYQTYKKPKDELIDFVIKYQGSLEAFLIYAKEHYPKLNLDPVVFSVNTTT